MTLANEVKSNSVQEKDEDVSLLDSSLTSLSWLQNLKVHDLISSPGGVKSVSSSPDQLTSSSISLSSPHKAEDSRVSRNTLGISLSPIKKCLLQSANFKKHPNKYCSIPDKPPFSYSTLIYLAIQYSKTGKVTLNEIYRWIKDNFKYYRHAEAGWQNSIRHNLSLNELFSKAPRAHRKGNYWKINPDYHHLLKDSVYFSHNGSDYSKLRSSKLKASYGRKRAHSHSGSTGQDKIVKRKRYESESKNGPADLPGDLDWSSLLGSQRATSQPYKPGFSSPDLAQAGENILCSPLVLPTSVAAAVPVEIPATPLIDESHGALLEEVVLKQDSPSPQVLLPWAEGNSQSPGSAQIHPWAESKESTMHELRNMFKVSKPWGNGLVLSPDQSWSSSSTHSSAGLVCRTPLLKGTSIY